MIAPRKASSGSISSRACSGLLTGTADRQCAHQWARSACRYSGGARCASVSRSAARPVGPVDPALVVRSGAGRDDLDAAELTAYADCYARRVRHMIEHGRRELTAGRGLLDVKGRLGFGTRIRHSVAAPRPVLGR
jgi:hypothetical protein